MTVPIRPGTPGGQHGRQREGIACHHLHARQRFLQVVRHLGDDFHHDEPVRRHPRIEQRARHDAGAGAEFHHELVRLAFNTGGDPPAQAWRGGDDGTHLQRIAEPTLKEQAPVCQQAFSRIAGSGHRDRAFPGSGDSR
ncbi:MAG TPA: hypothetical protein VEY31_15865 [Roseococcus sp.]|nr:hypothetical protein [Roseococcus sp.]